MAYTVGDLIDIFRREVDDPTFWSESNLPQPNTLWSNHQLIQYLNESQRDFARATLIFKDDYSFNPTVTADDPQVEYDPRILKVDRAELDSDNTLLKLVTADEFRASATIDDYGHKRPASWSNTAGTPRILITDIRMGYMRLWPIPTEDDSLMLVTRRYPLVDLTSVDDDIEVPEAYQLGLLKGVRAQAYSVPTAMMMGFDKLSLRAEVDWEDFKSTAHSRSMIRTRRPGRVKYGGL